MTTTMPACEISAVKLYAENPAEIGVIDAIDHRSSA